MNQSLDQIISNKTINLKNDSLITRPEIFNLQNGNDRLLFKELLIQNENIELHDNIYDQLVELVKINNVSKNLTTDETAQLINGHLNNVPQQEYGLWIYYPWLNKAIHLLGEDEFIKVRTNRNQHKITNNELEILKQKKIGIIGLSVGQAIASTLVLERCCGEIRLADFDDIQLSNLNRINTSLYNIGVLKVIQIAREIAELDPFINVVSYADGATENNIDKFLTGGGHLDLLIEECDSIDVKILARIKARQYNIPVVMETNDRGMVDIERYDLDNNYPMLHGLLGDIDYNKLKSLSREQALPVFLKFFSYSNVSARGKVTLVELGQSVSTWPQIASSVVLGGAVVTDISRRILLDQLKISGRFYVDIENIIKENIPSSYNPPQIEELSESETIKTANEVTSKLPVSTAVPENIIEQIVTDAGTAPSSGNDQPWNFLYKSNRLFLFHEYARSHSFGDYKNMASFISLGTAIENVVLSAHHHKKEIAVKVFPKEDNLKCVAVMSFSEQENESTEKHTFDNLYNYIQQRNTNRRVMPNEPADASVLHQIQLATESIEGAKISFITDKKELHTLGSLISVCDRIRIMNPQAHYEFFNREIHWTDKVAEEKRTGMAVSTLELPPQAMLALQTISDDNVMKVLRSIDGLKAYQNVSIPNTVNAAAMGFVSMPSYTPADFVNGGRAVQKQWLKATELGYAYHPMLIPLYLFPRLIYGDGEGLSKENIVELVSARKKFMELFPGDEKRGEVFLFRIFKAGDIEKRALRLPLSKILKFETDN